MKLYETANDPVFQEDLERIVAADLPWERFAGKTFLITGASGLVGSSFARALCCANRLRNLNARLVLAVRNVEKTKAVFGNLIERENIRLLEADICQPMTVDEPIDFIVHAAAVTNSKLMVTQPVETIMTAIDGTRHVLELAKEKRVEGMVYLSSMEAYGKPAEGKEYTRESDYGYIDFLTVRSCYPESKRMAECLCACYHAEYAVPVKIARLAQTFGAGISANENRVFAQFARSALNGENIVLHTAGDSYGNYCYTAECVAALLFLLVNGENGEAYNVTNESTNRMIREMAAMVAEMAEKPIEVVFDIPEDALKYGYAPSVKMCLSGEKLAELGWKAQIDLPEMYRRLMESMKATGNTKTPQ
ncbi:MAG: NAD-dependent epimerase/dehydratase family protein [Clostridia bacterium]|nr:NAD-dependent epimerase/dehydratase family protein [Clostridia bacterium]